MFYWNAFYLWYSWAYILMHLVSVIILSFFNRYIISIFTLVCRTEIKEDETIEIYFESKWEKADSKGYCDVRLPGYIYNATIYRYNFCILLWRKEPNYWEEHCLLEDNSFMRKLICEPNHSTNWFSQTQEDTLCVILPRSFFKYFRKSVWQNTWDRLVKYGERPSFSHGDHSFAPMAK